MHNDVIDTDNSAEVRRRRDRGRSYSKPKPAAAAAVLVAPGVREAEARYRIVARNRASAALIRYTHERGMRRASLERIWGTALVSAVLTGLVE